MSLSTTTVIITGKHPTFNSEKQVILSRTLPELKENMLKIFKEQGYTDIMISQ